MRIEIPELAVVALIGASGSGKSSFAAKHFKTTEVLSSDYFRGLVSDDENDQSASKSAFDVLYYIANKRLEGAKLTVIDATNVQKASRQGIIQLAKENNCLSVAIVFNTPEEICIKRNKMRPDRDIGDYVVKNHSIALKKSIKGLQKEGFRYIYILNSQEEVDNVQIIRTKLWNNKKDEHGPFDIIGDVHGCYDELHSLLSELGYIVDNHAFTATHPDGRKAIFLGDLTDRGPKSNLVLKLVMNMVNQNSALCVPGNHDVKLQRKLRGANVMVTHGLDKTLEQLETEPKEFSVAVEKYLDNLVSHYVLDDGKLVVAHAGLKEHLQGRGSAKVRDFCLYGETTGEIDEYGLPVRYNWADEYRGKALVVYGHTPQVDVQNINNTICIDTGCVFGGQLSAFRYPERKIVSVPAKQVYYEAVKPLFEKEAQHDDVLDITDVTGKKYLTTKLNRNITIYEEHSAAALEIMSRFAADPHWLVYLPPTMSPCETSSLEGILEHPIEAINYYKNRGISKVICEQKHMGSRAVIIVCRSSQAAKDRFGISDDREGIIYTRTGRHFFDDENMEKEIIKRLQKVLKESGFWDAYATDWVCLDTELMPWSAKAQLLLEQQYSSVGRAGRNGLNHAIQALKKAVPYSAELFEVDNKTSGQSVDISNVLDEFLQRKNALEKYTDAYRVYCWDVNSIDDLRIAPFHILATEGAVHNNQNHMWHMNTIKKYMTGQDHLFMATNHIIVDVTDETSIQNGVGWWENLTQTGGEGMVVKPFDFIAMKGSEVLQPAIKCRGKEYLRIIYGPEYDLKSNINRLKKRSLNKKRQLALKEFALGMESLERFVRKEPLYKVHECVFGVLAFESEPVDPRL